MGDWATTTFPVRSVTIMNTEVETAESDWESYWLKGYRYEAC